MEDRRGEETEHIVYHEPEGIKGFVKDLNKSTEVLHDVVYFKGETEGITVEAAFQYTNEFHENILGFCNNISTRRAEHTSPVLRRCLRLLLMPMRESLAS